MYSLLIVDDEAYIADGLRTLFEEELLELKRVTACYSGPEARALLAEYPYDILLSDIRMPGMSGLDFLEEVRGSGNRLKCIFLTGYDSFAYAKQAIHLGTFDYLLKPVEDQEIVACVGRVIDKLDAEMSGILEVRRLRDSLEESLAHSRALFVNRLLEKGMEPSMLNCGLFQRLHLAFDARRHVGLVVLRVDTWGEQFDSRDDLQGTIQNLFHEMAEGSLALCAAPQVSTLAGIFQEDQELSEVFLLKKFEKIQDSLYTSWGVILSFGLACGLEWGDVRASFKYLLATLRQSLAPGQILRSGSRLRHFRDQRLMELLGDILTNLKERQQNAYIRNIDDLLRVDMAGSGDSSGLGYFYIKLSETILDMAFDNNIEELMSADNMEKLTNFYAFGNSYELRSFLLYLYDVLSRDVPGADQHSSEQLIRNVKRYIKGNIASELSLDYLSQRFRINPCYLSRVFRETAGENLSTYICALKIKTAKRLLLDSDSKIYDIAQQVGFGTPNYFAKVFRKNVGVSPQEYRLSAGDGA